MRPSESHYPKKPCFTQTARGSRGRVVAERAETQGASAVCPRRRWRRRRAICAGGDRRAPPPPASLAAGALLAPGGEATACAVLRGAPALGSPKASEARLRHLRRATIRFRG